MAELDTIWGAVRAEAARLSQTHLRQLFAANPNRFSENHLRLDDLLIDFSKEKIDARAWAALHRLAAARGVAAKRDAMASGAAINATEGRAVLHMALRGGAPDAVAEGIGEVEPMLAKFLAFAEDVRAGRYAPPGGGRFTDVVNIGIGGSDLGPAMAARALRPDADGPRTHFLANVDGAHAADILADLNPATTLAVVASKTFTTMETMTNARTVEAWLKAGVGDAAAGGHMAAVTSNLAGAAAFGVTEDRVFGFWDWVGGRYSLWSSIGLPLALAIGAEGFRRLLAGARAMDAHFLSAPAEENLAIRFGLLGVWRRSLMGYPTVALIPYDQRLEFFAAYIQQLAMESNGKGVDLDGAALSQPACPVVWGEPGTNAQHSFFQMLHQGRDVIPVDFILAAEARESLGDHHAILIANCLAQARALAFGRTAEEAQAGMLRKGVSADEAVRLAPHRTFPGDRPSTLIMHQRLDPYALGRLIALYEHKTFVEGVIWGVNSFDQWGVELGKDLASELIPVVQTGAGGEALDGSTLGLLARLGEG